MSQPRTNRHFLRQTGGAFLWAIFFVLAPVEILLFSSILWIPLLIWRERIRSLRFGFLPGAVIRLGVVSSIICAAALLPTKYEDGKVGPLAKTDVSLGELAAFGVIYPLFDQQKNEIRVVLPSTTPTRREVMRVITQQTGLETSIFHCGNGATVLFGGGGGRISISENQAKPKQGAKPVS